MSDVELTVTESSQGKEVSADETFRHEVNDGTSVTSPVKIAKEVSAVDDHLFSTSPMEECPSPDLLKNQEGVHHDMPNDEVIETDESHNINVLFSEEEDQFNNVEDYVGVKDSSSKEDQFNNEEDLSAENRSNNKDHSTEDYQLSNTEDQQFCPAIFDYQLDQPPKLLSYARVNEIDNYFRGCKWSPDGTCILACNNDNYLRLYNLPVELYSSIPNEVLPQLVPALSSREGENIYDYCWFPLMSSRDVSTCCFASCSRSSPIHLWDAYDGQLRCSYLSFNHLEEMASPHSLSFSNCGTKLYAGYRDCIKVFETGRPGRESYTKTLYQRRQGGQNGIISSIAMDPVTQGNYALGSYSGSVSIHSNLTEGPLFLLHGLRCGVTHLGYSPEGNLLFTGERKSPDLTCWDLRQPTKVFRQFRRTVETNQRVYFDVSQNGRWLVSAATDGNVSFWDLFSAESSEVQDPVSWYKLHEDCINGCSLHPLLPLMVTSSGQWKFFKGRADSDSDEGEEIESYDNSLKVWSLMGKATGDWDKL